MSFKRAMRMRSYTFRAVHRRPDGVIGPTLYEHTIAAADDDAAVKQARALDLDLSAVGANAVYLAAPDGRAVWSLHVAGAPIEG